jgi:hypothetical protein
VASQETGRKGRFDLAAFGVLWLLVGFAVTILATAYVAEGIVDGTYFLPLRRGRDMLLERSSNPAGYYAVLSAAALLAGVSLVRFASMIRNFVGLDAADVSPLHVLVMAGFAIACGGYGLEGVLDGTIFIAFGGDSDVRLVNRLNPGGFYIALAGLLALAIVFLSLLIHAVRKLVSAERAYWRNKRR